MYCCICIGLINENTKLNEEKRELEKMHKQDKDDLDVRVREMLSQQETLQVRLIWSISTSNMEINCSIT